MFAEVTGVPTWGVKDVAGADRDPDEAVGRHGEASKLSGDDQERLWAAWLWRGTTTPRMAHVRPTT